MQITLIDFMSLDGVVQAPGGADEDREGDFAHGGWSVPYFDVDVMGGLIGELSAGTEALLFGRRTWQGMAAAWPGRAGDPYADWINAVPKYVASRTLAQEDLTWSNSTLLPASDAVGAIRELRAREGTGIQIWGSSPAGDPARRTRPRRRVPAHDRADPARRGQAGVPRGRHGAPARAGLGDARLDRRARLHLPPRSQR